MRWSEHDYFQRKDQCLRDISAAVIACDKGHTCALYIYMAGSRPVLLQTSCSRQCWPYRPLYNLGLYKNSTMRRDRYDHTQCCDKRWPEERSSRDGFVAFLHVGTVHANKHDYIQRRDHCQRDRLSVEGGFAMILHSSSGQGSKCDYLQRCDQGQRKDLPVGDSTACGGEHDCCQRCDQCQREELSVGDAVPIILGDERPYRPLYSFRLYKGSTRCRGRHIHTQCCNECQRNQLSAGDGFAAFLHDGTVHGDERDCT